MKVLFIHPNNNYTGQEVSLLERVSGLIEAGVSCEIILPDEGQFSGLLREANIPTRQLTLTRLDKGKLLAFLRSILTLRKYIKDNHFSLVHCSGVYSHQFAIWAAKLAGVPCVTSVNTTVYTAYDFRKNYMTRSDKVFCVSDAVRNKFLDNCALAPQKVVTLYDGYRLDNISINPDIVTQFKKDFEISDQHFVVGVIGEVIPRKGIEYFVEMAHALKSQYPHFKFLIIGKHASDAYEKRIREQIDQHGLTNDVLFTGFYDDIYSIISLLNVVVVSSLAEGLCRVIVEAQHMLINVVSTDVSGNGEAIRDGEDGFLVEAKNPEALAERVSYLYNNPDEAKRMREKAQARVHDKFTLKMHVENLIKMYQKALDDK